MPGILLLLAYTEISPVPRGGSEVRVYCFLDEKKLFDILDDQGFSVFIFSSQLRS